MRVLVVEDEADDLDRRANGTVRRRPCVDVAADGLEALDWEASYPYDLLILDVVLPGLDGFGVCAHVGGRGVTSRS